MTRGIHWFRSDLRLQDNTALAALCARVHEWLPVFVLDPRLLGGAHAGAPRVRFLLDCLARLSRDLSKRGVPLLLRTGLPEDVLPRLLHETGARVLSFNEAPSPFAHARDAAVRRIVERQGSAVVACTDGLVFAAGELRTLSGDGYRVYTPFRKAWWKRWREEPRRVQRLRRLPPAIPGFAADATPDAGALGLAADACDLPTGGEGSAKRLLARFLAGAADRYHEDRDRPDRDGTSRLSPHLRFGTISPRQCFESAEDALRSEPKLKPGVGKWLDELIWREFYAGLLEEHPRVLRESFRCEYDAVAWSDDRPGFEAWCDGRTGYPIIDAGMRQLRATGWMHNRVRMLTASFLTKDLGIDWRAGERFFFEHLVDGDPASNNGGWQWAASTGSDSQPWFRIFNPVTQGERWDPEGRYVRRWIPELRGVPDRYVHAPWRAGGPPAGYAEPIADHAERRALALQRLSAARKRKLGR